MTERSRSLTVIAAAYIVLHGWGLISAAPNVRLFARPLPGLDAWARLFFASKILWAVLGLAAGLQMLRRRAWAREWALWSSLVMLVVFFVSQGPQAVRVSLRSANLVHSAVTTLAMVGLATLSVLYFPSRGAAKEFAAGTGRERWLVRPLAAAFLVFWTVYTVQPVLFTD